MSSATSIVALSLPVDRSFRLTPPPRFIAHWARFGSVPLHPPYRTQVQDISYYFPMKPVTPTENNNHRYSDPQFFSANGEKQELHHQEQEQIHLLPALVDEGGAAAQSAGCPGGSLKHVPLNPLAFPKQKRRE
ncbi:MAG: hypothetical protein E7326_01285 [Clostridiales bacterium]|nr:hypothetical protein [Clostridiales bacterium]